MHCGTLSKMVSLGSSLRRFGVAVVAAALFVAVSGHICLISPLQRGGVGNLTVPGDYSCFKLGGPCGGDQPGPIVAEWTGGSTVQVSFQQAYNHYQVGMPGAKY